MKYMIIGIILFSGLLCSCGNTTTGYLKPENAHYDPDTTVFKAMLDPENPDDARQLELQYPFSSNEVQGVLGTQPVYYDIYTITCDKSTAEAIGQFYMSGKGKIQLPYDHTVPVGRYHCSLKIWNETKCYYTDEILTIIVK